MLRLQAESAGVGGSGGLRTTIFRLNTKVFSTFFPHSPIYREIYFVLRIFAPFRSRTGNRNQEITHMTSRQLYDQGFPAQPGNFETPVESLRFEPVYSILQRVRTHPDANYAYLDYDAPPSEVPIVDFGPEPEDPEARFQWHVDKRVQSNMGRMMVHQLRDAHFKRKHRGYHIAVHGLKANDPLYERAMDIMHHYLSKLPKVFMPLVMPTLLSHSPTFMSLYMDMRHVAETVEHCLHHRNKKRAASAKAEAPGQRPCDGPNTPARAAELAALKERVRRGGAQEGDLLKYLDLTGMIPGNE